MDASPIIGGQSSLAGATGGSEVYGGAIFLKSQDSEYFKGIPGKGPQEEEEEKMMTSHCSSVSNSLETPEQPIKKQPTKKGKTNSIRKPKVENILTPQSVLQKP